MQEGADTRRAPGNDGVVGDLVLGRGSKALACGSGHCHRDRPQQKTSDNHRWPVRSHRHSVNEHKFVQVEDYVAEIDQGRSLREVLPLGQRLG